MATKIRRLILQSLLLLFFFRQVPGIRLLFKSTDPPRSDDFRVVYFSMPNDDPTVLFAGPARFGIDLKMTDPIESTVEHVQPPEGCTDLTNSETLPGKIAIVRRGSCQFAEKALYIQKAGAVGGIVIDYSASLSTEKYPVFIMGSGSVTERVTVPMVFLYATEGEKLLNASTHYPNLVVGISAQLPISVPRTDELTTEVSETELLTEVESNEQKAYPESAEEQQQKPQKQTNAKDGVSQPFSTINIALICGGVLLVVVLFTVSVVCWRRSSMKRSGGSPDEFQFSRLGR